MCKSTSPTCLADQTGVLLLAQIRMYSSRRRGAGIPDGFWWLSTRLIGAVGRGAWASCPCHPLPRRFQRDQTGLGVTRGFMQNDPLRSDQSDCEDRISPPGRRDFRVIIGDNVNTLELFCRYDEFASSSSTHATAEAAPTPSRG